MDTSRSVPHLLAELFDAELLVRQLHAELSGADRASLLAALSTAIAKARSIEPDQAEAQLVCAARLLGEIADEVAVDGLIDVLGFPHLEARAEAGEQLSELAVERFALVAAGAERALERLPHDDPALVELPFVLAEAQHEDAVELLGRMLEHDSADVVGAAIEALVLLGDPAALPRLAELRGDTRTTVLGDDETGRFEGTVGELAADAIALLSAPGPLPTQSGGP